MANFIQNQHNLPSLDYIVEQGANYTKWNSGKLEQIMYGTVDFPSGTSWGSVYYHDFSMGDWPIPFTQVFWAKEQVKNNTYWSNLAGYTLKSSGTIRVFRPTSGVGSNINVSIYAIGRWK